MLSLQTFVGSLITLQVIVSLLKVMVVKQVYVVLRRWVYVLNWLSLMTWFQMKMLALRLVLIKLKIQSITLLTMQCTQRVVKQSGQVLHLMQAIRCMKLLNLVHGLLTATQYVRSFHALKKSLKELGRIVLPMHM